MQRHSGASSPPTSMPTLVKLPKYVNTLNIFFLLYISIHVFYQSLFTLPLNFPLSLSILSCINCFIVIFMYFVVSRMVVWMKNRLFKYTGCTCRFIEFFLGQCTDSYELKVPEKNTYSNQALSEQPSICLKSLFIWKSSLTLPGIKRISLFQGQTSAPSPN